MSGDHLVAEREAARDAISAIQLTVPWAFETSPADSADPLETALREVNRCDIFVLIVGNQHSPAVQAELGAAHDNDKPILAFVERMAEANESAARFEVLQQLMPRHKFQMFASTEELRREIHDAITSELIRGYRDRYRPRINDADIETLLQASAKAAEEIPSLLVRRARQDDRPEIEILLTDLNRWYPSIQEWMSESRVLDALDTNENVRVADLDGRVRGITIARDKGDSVRKFSTIYISPNSQGTAIGPHLVREEVKRAAADGVRKAYVTFAAENAPRIRPVLEQSGFIDEGIATARYRPQSAEFVMGKTFAHDIIKQENFADFVYRYLVLNSGGTTSVFDRDGFTATMPAPSLLSGIEHRNRRFVVSSDPVPETEYTKLQNDSRDLDWTFVSLFGKPASTAHPSHDAPNWIDGADLAVRYFPVQFDLPEQDSMIVTILPHYADALIPRSITPSLFSPSRLQIRPDNVYYRSADRYETLRRGTRIFFYVSQPEHAIRGSAVITEITVDTPEECFARYGTKGILQFADLVRTAGDSNEVLAIAFDWYTEYPKPVTLAQIKNLFPAYNPITASVINGTLASRIHEEGLHG